MFKLNFLVCFTCNLGTLSNPFSIVFFLQPCYLHYYKTEYYIKRVIQKQVTIHMKHEHIQFEFISIGKFTCTLKKKKFSTNLPRLRSYYSDKLDENSSTRQTNRSYKVINITELIDHKSRTINHI